MLYTAIDGAVAPDGRWLIAWAQLNGEGSPVYLAFPLDGGAPILTGNATFWDWAPGRRYVAVVPDSGAPNPDGRSCLVPPMPGQTYPQSPGGFQTERPWPACQEAGGSTPTASSRSGSWTLRVLPRHPAAQSVPHPLLHLAFVNRAVTRFR
jgi:hypothetical protein